MDDGAKGIGTEPGPAKRGGAEGEDKGDDTKTWSCCLAFSSVPLAVPTSGDSGAAEEERVRLLPRREEPKFGKAGPGMREDIMNLCKPTNPGKRTTPPHTKEKLRELAKCVNAEKVTERVERQRRTNKSDKEKRDKQTLSRSLNLGRDDPFPKRHESWTASPSGSRARLLFLRTSAALVPCRCKDKHKLGRPRKRPAQKRATKDFRRALRSERILKTNTHKIMQLGERSADATQGNTRAYASTNR